MSASTAPSTSHAQGHPHADLCGPTAVVEADPASLAAIARQETALIYGRTLRDGTGRELPATDLAWERYRLARAVRDLTRGDA